jgi:hypothetical protein
MLPCVLKTDSGILVKKWVAQLIQHHRVQNRHDGPAITDFNGKVMSTKVLDDHLVEILEELHEENPKWLPISIQTKDDIGSSFQVFQILRRSSDTRALVSTPL